MGWLAADIAIVELDHIGVQEHLCGRSKADTVLLPIGPFLDAVPFKVHGRASRNILTFSTFGKIALRGSSRSALTGAMMIATASSEAVSVSMSKLRIGPYNVAISPGARPAQGPQRPIC